MLKQQIKQPNKKIRHISYPGDLLAAFMGDSVWCLVGDSLAISLRAFSSAFFWIFLSK